MSVYVRRSASICVEARSTRGEDHRERPEFATGIVPSSEAQRSAAIRGGAWWIAGRGAGRQGTIAASYRTAVDRDAVFGRTFFLLSQGRQGLLLCHRYQGSRHRGFLALCQSV